MNLQTFADKHLGPEFEAQMRSELARQELERDVFLRMTFDAVPLDPFFGFAGIDLRDRILPALCGPMGRILPEDF